MRRLLSAALVLAVSAPLAAQSSGDVAAYLALASTPAGGVAPSLAAPLMMQPASTRWRVQYGQIGDSDFRMRNIVGGVDVAAGPGVFGLTAGWDAPSCPAGSGCKGNFLAGVDWTTRLVGTPAPANAARFALGLKASVGYAKPHGTDPLSGADISLSTWSASLGLPVAMTASAGGVSISPFVTPGYGWGRVSTSYSGSSTSENGTRFLLGGGVQVGFRSGVALMAGMQKVFITGGKTAFGAGLSWQFGS